MKLVPSGFAIEFKYCPGEHLFWSDLLWLGLLYYGWGPCALLRSDWLSMYLWFTKSPPGVDTVFLKSCTKGAYSICSGF